METNSSGSRILYLQLEINCPQNKCLSVIILDTTVTINHWEENNNDHDQEFLIKELLHTLSWSSEELLSEGGGKTEEMTLAA